MRLAWACPSAGPRHEQRMRKDAERNGDVDDAESVRRKLGQEERVARRLERGVRRHDEKERPGGTRDERTLAAPEVGEAQQPCTERRHHKTPAMTRPAGADPCICAIV